MSGLDDVELSAKRVIDGPATLGEAIQETAEGRRRGMTPGDSGETSSRAGGAGEIRRLGPGIGPEERVEEDVSTRVSRRQAEALAHTGGRSLRVTTPIVDRGVYQEVKNLVPGMSYQFQAWVRSESGTNLAALAVCDSNYTGFVWTGVRTATTDWQLLTVTFTATSQGVARVHLAKHDTTGALLWDDVELVNGANVISGVKLRYYPYGQEVGTATANDVSKFGTYTRDSGSGLDYAMNRYYMSTWGRFTTADPYRASGRPGDPGSWNRYSYVQGDPVNYYDPLGLQLAGPGFCSAEYSYAECVALGLISTGGGGGGSGGGPTLGGPLGSSWAWFLPMFPIVLAPPSVEPCNVDAGGSADRVAAIAVAMGENSYVYIGRNSYAPGDVAGSPTGGGITRQTVLVESQIMVSVLINRAGSRYFGGRTIATVAAAAGQFDGYANGSALAAQAVRSSNTSVLCDRLRLAAEAVDGVLAHPEAYRYDYYYWKATVGDDNQVRVLGSGEFRVARTDFQIRERRARP